MDPTQLTTAAGITGWLIQQGPDALGTQVESSIIRTVYIRDVLGQLARGTRQEFVVTASDGSTYVITRAAKLRLFRPSTGMFTVRYTTFQP